MFPRLPPATRALLLINVAVFLLQQVPGLGQLIDGLFALWPPASGLFHPWQLLTYAFLHGSWAHIFFNMFALYMFGGALERYWGGRRLVIFYLVCVLSAALTQIAVQYPAGATEEVIGASGGIFGILLLFGMAYPQRQLLLLFPPIPMPAWLFVTLYGVLELCLGVFGTSQGVAHFAHLGGMATGYVLIRYWRARAGSRHYH